LVCDEIGLKRNDRFSMLILFDKKKYTIDIDSMMMFDSWANQFLLPRPNFHPCGGIIIDLILLFDFGGV